MHEFIKRIFNDGDKFRIGSVNFDHRDDHQTQKEKFARIILDQMYHFAGLLTSDGRILEINVPALSGAGLRIEDVVGIPFWEARWFALSEESKALQRAMVQRAANGEFIRRDIEVYGEASGEKTIITDYSLTPLKDEAGNVRFILAEGRNITEKKQFESEIARKNTELEEILEKNRDLDNKKDHFFANISHELKTPLSLIIGPVDDILSNDIGLSKRQKTDLVAIRRNAITMLNLVNELLDLAKVDAGKVQLFYEAIPLAGFIKEIASHFDAIALQSNIAFAVTVPDELEIEADSERLGQIVFNLISNAFSVTPRGGRISCNVERPDSQRVLITVKDTGPGIDSDQATRIFERFEQGDGLLQSSRKGTGLGLAIVKEFVDLHGGIVTATNSSVGGAVFSVELPYKAPCGTGVRPKPTDMTRETGILVPRQGIHEESSPDVPGNGRPLILVVDDNHEMRNLIGRILGNEYRVRTAGGARQALAALETEPPDLIMTDLMMPEYSGDEMIKSIRNRIDSGQIPILVLSAHADITVKNELLSKYVQDYVTKPFFVPELLSRVRNLLMMRETRLVLQKELKSRDTDLIQLTRELIEGRRELQNSVDALRKSEGRWRAIHENFAVGIAAVDGNWMFVNVNPAFCRMLGYGADELLGRSIMEITHQADRSFTGHRLTQLLSGEIDNYHHRKRFINKQGEAVWTSSSVSVIPQTEDTPPLLIGVVKDISETKKAELELEEARLELARVMRVTSMGELVASITHEINQPLSAIVSNSQAALQWLSHTPPNRNEAIGAIKSILRDGERAANVAIRIRGFMKRDATTSQPVAWPTLITDVLDYVNETARKKGIEIHTDLARDLPVINSDKVQLQQILLNLVLNAMEAMDGMDARAGPWNGGKILRIRVWLRSHTILVLVADNGPGVASEVRARVFEPFFTTKSNGLGMGLPLCRTIANRLGGDLVLLDNENGREGASFQLSLPLENKKND
ncbi:ATP-binding protein [Alloalcanivorax profundimaris]|uniref:ATP-binding protein n=1 Tax=Alloalcanivorax profundimaris TaxID=2735259 RepID=UPI0018884C3F|nr:ATP-binding protein [Alloalcanivorax profundimaris]MBF1801842.1 PAS domain S-box protein [Alloalcanivorax profundimaris]